MDSLIETSPDTPYLTPQAAVKAHLARAHELQKEDDLSGVVAALEAAFEQAQRESLAAFGS